MVDVKKKGSHSKTIIALVAATAGIIIPILWSWWSTKSELTLTKEQAANVIEKKSSIEGLSIKYAGHEIEALTKVTFTLKNTGRTPIERSDLIAPPNLTIKEGTLLNTTIESTIPENLGGELLKNGNSIQIRFGLMNPGDSITISTLISGQDPTYLIESRIKNITQIQNIDTKNQIRIKSHFGIGIYIVGFFTTIFFFALIGLITDIPKRNRVHRALQAGKVPIYPGEPASSAVIFIENTLSFLTKNRKSSLKYIAVKNGDILAEENTAELIGAMRSYVEGYAPAGGAFAVLIMVLAGTYYLYSNIVA